MVRLDLNKLTMRELELVLPILKRLGVREDKRFFKEDKTEKREEEGVVVRPVMSKRDVLWKSRVDKAVEFITSLRGNHVPVSKVMKAIGIDVRYQKAKIRVCDELKKVPSIGFKNKGVSKNSLVFFLKEEKDCEVSIPKSIDINSSDVKGFPEFKTVPDGYEKILVGITKKVIANNSKMSYLTDGFPLGISSGHDWREFVEEFKRRSDSVAKFFGAKNKFRVNTIHRNNKTFHELHYGEVSL